MAQRNQQNFNAMRQDAIRRSREMHRRADQESSPPSEESSSPQTPPPSPPPPSPPPQKPQRSPLGDLSGLLEGLSISDELHGLLTDWDGEKLALAGILYLLWKEGGDPILLIALAYILL